MNKQRRYYILVPTSVVRGKECKLDAKTFVVYCYLLFQEFKAFRKNKTLEEDHVDLKITTAILDNRTLKRCLNDLHQLGIIDEKIENLPKKQHLNITLASSTKHHFFTKMPVNLFAHIREIGHVGFQLLFYYESYINRKQVNKEYAFPSFKAIRRDLGISFDTLLKYNDVLTRVGFLSVIRSESDNSNEREDKTFNNWNNRYYLQLHKL